MKICIDSIFSEFHSVHFFIRIWLIFPPLSCLRPPNQTRYPVITLHAALSVFSWSSWPPRWDGSTRNIWARRNFSIQPHVRIPCAKSRSRCLCTSGTDVRTVSPPSSGVTLSAPSSLPTDRTGLFRFFPTFQAFSSCSPNPFCPGTLQEFFLTFAKSLWQWSQVCVLGVSCAMSVPR